MTTTTTPPRRSPVNMQDLDLGDAGLARFYEYWRSKCDGDRLPSRADVDPLDFPDLLPGVTLIDVVEGGPRRRYRIRLFGTDHVKFHGADRTGAFIDEVFQAGDQSAILAAYDRVVEGRKPHHWHAHFSLPEAGDVYYERLMLPLSSEGGPVDKLIGLFAFDRIEKPRP